MFFIFKIARFRRPWLIGGRPARKLGGGSKKPKDAGGGYGERWGHLFVSRSASPAAKKAGLRRALTAGTGLLSSTGQASSGRMKAEARKADHMTNRKPLAGG